MNDQHRDDLGCVAIPVPCRRQMDRPPSPSFRLNCDWAGMNFEVLSDGAGGVRLVDRPVPAKLCSTHVVVRMSYAPINPADLLILEGRYGFDLPLDLPLGSEGVGVVERVGTAVAEVKPGDRVLPLDRGNWCARRRGRQGRYMRRGQCFARTSAARKFQNRPNTLSRHRDR